MPDPMHSIFQPKTLPAFLKALCQHGHHPTTPPAFKMVTQVVGTSGKIPLYTLCPSMPLKAHQAARNCTASTGFYFQAHHSVLFGDNMQEQGTPGHYGTRDPRCTISILHANCDIGHKKRTDIVLDVKTLWSYKYHSRQKTDKSETVKIK